jgi:hypothetical protein
LIPGARRAWEGFWFRPAFPLGLIVARVLLAANALWIVLSRADLADLAGWPSELWAGVSPGLRLRYLILPVAPSLEQAAYFLLGASLLAAFLGITPRVSCFVAATLLYHFAPFEEILTTRTGPYQGGLTLPTLGLFILSFVPAPAWGSAPPPDCRWPVVLLRMLLAMSYLFAGVAKLTLTGPHWMSADNIEATALVFMTYEVPPAWAHWLVDHPWNARLAGIGMWAFEMLFVTALFWRTLAWIAIPLGLAFHLLAFEAFGSFPFNAPLLLLLVDWDALAALWRARKAMAT